MSTLPDRAFLVNYNARDYNPATNSIPKTEGQIFDSDLVFSGGTPTVNDDGSVHIYHQYMLYSYASTTANPFNKAPFNQSGNRGTTIIYKIKGDVANDEQNVFTCRDANNYNYMVRQQMLHTSSSGFLRINVPITEPTVTWIRIPNAVYPTGEKVCVTTGARTTQDSTTFGYQSKTIGFFTGYGHTHSEGGDFLGNFYWLYMTNEVLTDEEIQQVIDYNEEDFRPDVKELSFGFEGGSETIGVMASGEWDFESNANWLTCTKTQNSITINCRKNDDATREGTIRCFNTEGGEFEITVYQMGRLIYPYKKIIRGQMRIN